MADCTVIVSASVDLTSLTKTYLTPSLSAKRDPAEDHTMVYARLTYHNHNDEDAFYQPQ